METNSRILVSRNGMLYNVNFNRCIDLIKEFLYSYKDNEINKISLEDYRNVELVVKLLCQNPN